MISTLIIGKESNLSQKLYKLNSDFILISSRGVLKSIDILEAYKDKKINIIFNNFQPATELNKLEECSQYITSSILITSMVLDYFQDTKINKIIYTSSSSVYGNNILCNENDELKPMNLHASLKVSNEKLIEKYCLQKNIDYTIARIFNMYGGDDKFSVISKILKAIEEKEEITIVNNGNAIRDFIHINDVVSIYEKLLGMRGVNLLNIGTGNGSSIKNILDFLSNNNVELKTKNIFRDELKISTADNQRLLEVTGKKDFLKVEEYLKKKLDL